MEEAEITINGVTLDYAQSMTIRCALEHFSMELFYNGLGKDEHGKTMTSCYLKNIDSIRPALYKNIKSTTPNDHTND